MIIILVVEDESEIREVLVEVLTEAGFEIIEAETADEAIPLLNLENIQLIVTDINLPGRLDGIGLASSARKAHPHIPVIFISGRPGKLEDAHVLGDPVAYLQKPFSVRTLLSDIERLTGH